MAITATYITSSLTASGLTAVVNSGTGFPTAGAAPVSPGLLCRIDKEYFWAVAQPVAGQITLRMRGSNGTVASAHDVLAKIEVGATPQDFAAAAPGRAVTLPPDLPVYTTLGQDTVFTSDQIAAFGNQPQNFAITKASAAAITLVAPNKSQDGLTLTFTSLTDQTHAITATSLLANAGAASPYTTATIANAKAGGGLTLQAQNGLWNVIAVTNWTLS